MSVEIFVDTVYLVARLNPKDQWHTAALALDSRLHGKRLITTETVLIELLNYLAEFPAPMRRAVARFTKTALSGTSLRVVFHTHDAFLRGLELYERRWDKGYSLTDCISMSVMRQRGMREVLSHDHHFTQEGFEVLM